MTILPGDIKENRRIRDNRQARELATWKIFFPGISWIEAVCCGWIQPLDRLLEESVQLGRKPDWLVEHDKMK
jgi:hypothetical protein